jgi:hypothetical protein
MKQKKKRVLGRNKKERRRTKSRRKKRLLDSHWGQCPDKAINIEILFQLSKIRTESILVFQLTLYSDDASERKYESIWLISTLHGRIICNYIKATGIVDLIYLHSPVYFHTFPSNCLAERW